MQRLQGSHAAKKDHGLAAQEAGVQAACEEILRRYGEVLSLADLAAAAQLPPTTLARQFRRTYGMSPIRWLWLFRTLLSAEMIAAKPGWNLESISLLCGFTSQAHFSRRFRALFRQAPRTFRRHFQRTFDAQVFTQTSLQRLESTGPTARYDRLVTAALAKLTTVSASTKRRF